MNPSLPSGPRCPAEGLEPRMLFAEIEVGIGDGAAPAAQYTDADGTAVRVAINGGMLALRFSGEALAESVHGAEVHVTGTGVSLVSAAARGTSRRTSVTFAASGGNGRAVVGAITAEGALKKLEGPQVVLTAVLTTGGPVRNLRLLRAENATIALGGGRGSSSVEIREGAIDSDLSSAAPLRRLELGSWTGADGADTITAPSIGKAVVAGVFAGDIRAGAISSMEVVAGYRIERSSIHVTRNLRRLVVHGPIEDSFVDVGGNIGFVSVALLSRSRVYAGVRPLPLEASVPAGVADFTSSSSIRRFRQFYTPSADTSVVAARFMGTVVLGEVGDAGWGGSVFVADQIGRVVARVGTAPSYRTQTLKDLKSTQHSFGRVEVRAL